VKKLSGTVISSTTTLHPSDVLRRAVTLAIGWAYSGRSPGYPVTVWLDHLTAVRGSR
jgi:hypothetical protein